MGRVLNFIVLTVVIFVAIVVMLDSIKKNNAEQTSPLTPPVKHELNFTPPNLSGDVFVSDALGECDLAGTKTTKTANVCEKLPIPVSDTVVITTKEYKIFGLPVWKSKKIELGRE